MNIFYKTPNRIDILNALKSAKIISGQLDINGRCNANCWYCPIKYEGNPEKYIYQTTTDELETILSNLRKSKLFPADVNFIYTCHYNEILLYKNFSEMIRIFRKYNFRTMVLSNGTPLTPSKIDLINKNKDVIVNIALNIPALEKDDWSLKSGFSKSVHPILINNLDYLNKNYTGAVVGVNCSTNTDVLDHNGIHTNKEKTNAILNDFKEKYPNINSFLVDNLSDRASNLVKNNVFKQRILIKKNNISGCTHTNSNGGRVFTYVHINPKGELFLCCDDFNMNYTFGSLLEKRFDDIWLSEEHIDVIIKARNEICSTCQSSV